MLAMRGSLIVLALALASSSNMCGLLRPQAMVPPAASLTMHPTITNSSKGSSARVDFATQVRPILESRCQPCHFAGGKMYQRLPFDRPETVKALGEKLFTRIKDENERRVIREFLAQ